MRTNIVRDSNRPKTHEGAPAKRIPELKQLERSLNSCLLWEDEFYESGEEIALRIRNLVRSLCPQMAAEVRILAHKARHEIGLRHAPLWVAVALGEVGALTSELVRDLCDRPDQMGELISLWWRDGKRPLPAAMKRGLREAVCRFDAYQLGKYNGGKASIRLRDILRLVHPKPQTPEQSETFKSILEDMLASPDTWEVQLSGGADKLQTWTRLLSERKLGTLALIRNLRNMQEAGVNRELIRAALAEASAHRIFPFQVYAASLHAPDFEPELEQLLFRTAATYEKPPLSGCTAILVDLSGSMDIPLSGRGAMSRRQAALGTAMVARELCQEVVCFGFGQTVAKAPPRRGFALADAINRLNVGHATNMREAIAQANQSGATRIIAITDEQSATRVQDPGRGIRGYMVNVASAKNGVGYGGWSHIDGFSGTMLKYIIAAEQL